MMDLPSGTNAIVDAGIEEAAQSLFDVAEVPLARAEELLDLVRGTAVRAVLEQRIAQVVKHGHTPAADAELNLKVLPNHARQMILDCLDLLDPGVRQNLVVARRRMAKAAAMLIAAIGRVDVELAGRGE